jgi:hypothetical protein
MDPDQTAQAGLDPCWSQTNYVGFDTAHMVYPPQYLKTKKLSLTMFLVIWDKINWFYFRKC